MTRNSGRPSNPSRHWKSMRTDSSFSGSPDFQNFARDPMLVNKRFSAPCYRPQTLASNLAKSQIFLHLSPNFRAVMLWATDLLRPATISGSSPRPIALKRVAHAIHPRFKPRNDPIASKDLQKKQVSPSEATCSVSFAQLSGVYN